MRMMPDTVSCAADAAERCLDSGLKQDFQVAFNIINVSLQHSRAGSHLNFIWNTFLLELLRGWLDHMRELEDIDEFIDLIWTVRRSTTGKVPYDFFLNLGNVRAKAEEKYRTGATLDYINESIRHKREEIKGISKDHANFYDQIYKLQHRLRRRYDKTEDAHDLNEAIEIGRTVVQNICGKSSSQERMMLQRRRNHKYTETEDINTAIEAIEIGTIAIQSMCGVSNSREKLLKLLDLGNLIEIRMIRAQTLEDLDESVTLWREIALYIPHSCSGFSNALLSLTYGLCRRCMECGSIEDFEEATDTAKQTLDATSDCDAIMQVALSAYIEALNWFCENEQHKLNLDEVIPFAKRCIQLPLGANVQTVLILNVATLLAERSVKTGNLEDLEEAIQTMQPHVRAEGQDPAPLLGLLGTQLLRRYIAKRCTEDLERAIDSTQAAIQLTKIESNNYRAAIDQLSTLFLEKYKITDEIAYLRKAIDLWEQASALGSVKSRPDLLSGLANSLGDRYKITNDIVDLNEAIRLMRLAFELCSTDESKYYVCAIKLSFLLRSLYSRTNNVAQLDEAIFMVLKAIRVAPDSRLTRHPWQGILGRLWGNKYERSRAAEDFFKAAYLLQRSITIRPENSLSHVRDFLALSYLFFDRYEETHKMAYLTEAISLTEKSIMVTPEDSPKTSIMYHGLGCFFSRLFGSTQDIEDQEMALNFFLCGWNSSLGNPYARAKCGIVAILILFARPMDGRAIDIGITLINLLSRLQIRSLSLTDQEYVLSRFTGLASILFSLFLSARCLSEALEYFEQGRAIMISQMIDDRNDLSILKQNHPTIADRYQGLINEINSSLDTTGSGEIHRRIFEKRRHKVNELDQCLNEIRILPGYERFLMGKTDTELQQCAGEGIIVIVNITPIRSDAFLMSSERQVAYEFPHCFTREIHQWVSKDWTLKKRSGYYSKNKEFSVYLAWLWDNCVGRIIELMTIVRGHLKEGLPKVWWIGGGLGSSIPFHAAGYHEHGSLENTYSKVISSYTPSIKALEHSRFQLRRAKEVQPGYNNMLIALMPTSPKDENGKKAFKPLHGVIKEKDEIMAIAQGNVHTTVLDHPSAEQVLKTLGKTSIAHFACHGISDKDFPANSGLILQRGGGPGQQIKQDRLTVQDITRLNLTHARIAYLSACSTAETKKDMSDEIIHIVSGFQVAGFPHVIGCLWPAADRVCVKIAAEFYSLLFGKNDQDPMDEDVAWCLQKAVMKAREESPTTPLEWAQFVHYGA